MKRALLVCLVGLISQQSFASPALGLVEQKALAHLSATAHKAAPITNTCTDFSGHWKGQCSVEGKSFDLSRDIKQEGCSIFLDGGDLYSVGGIKNDVQTQINADGVNVSYAISVSPSWNADQTQLVTQVVGLVTVQGYSPVSVSGNGTLLLSNNKLEETVDIANTLVSCSFSKE